MKIICLQFEKRGCGLLWEAAWSEVECSPRSKGGVRREGINSWKMGVIVGVLSVHSRTGTLPSYFPLPAKGEVGPQ